MHMHQIVSLQMNVVCWFCTSICLQKRTFGDIWNTFLGQAAICVTRNTNNIKALKEERSKAGRENTQSFIQLMVSYLLWNYCQRTKWETFATCWGTIAGCHWLLDVTGGTRWWIYSTDCEWGMCVRSSDEGLFTCCEWGMCVCVVVTKDYSDVVNEECGQVHSRTVSAAEFSARLLSDGVVSTTSWCIQRTKYGAVKRYAARWLLLAVWWGILMMCQAFHLVNGISDSLIAVLVTVPPYWPVGLTNDVYFLLVFYINHKW